MWKVAAGCAIGAGAVCCRPAEACGPFFPNQLLFNGDKAVLDAPQAMLVSEIGRLAKAKATPFKAVVREYSQNLEAQALAADVAELEAAMNGMKLGLGEAAARVAAYKEVRGAVIASHWRDEVELKQRLGSLKVPAGLPGEFADYLAGAIAWERGERDNARAAWQRVLNRPEGERKYRSTWAAFMIGRSFLDGNPEMAGPWFAKTRELAAKGFADSQGLAAESLGWDGRAEFLQEHYEKAMAFYVMQHATGDGSAVPSLQLVCEAVFKAGPGVVQRMAKDLISRQVMTAYIVARGGPNHPTPKREQALAWLKAMEEAGAKQVEGAERLAWIAYQQGEMKLAERWLARSPEDAPFAWWVKAKLLLRAGKTDAAAAALSKAVRAFAKDDVHVWLATSERLPNDLEAKDHASGELALVQLSRKQFASALDLLLRAGLWKDAAYVGERVLSVDELKNFVDHWRADAGVRQTEPPQDTEGQIETELAKNKAVAEYNVRYLLARRLTRVGRYAEARPYFSRAFQSRLDVYAKAVNEGRDAKRAAADRAESLFAAARIARYEGMELMGTELAPDFQIHAGQYQEETEQREHDRKAVVVRPTREESSRFAASAAKPDSRFHYRYVAADLTWEAAALLPDNTERKAEMLCRGGTWLAARDQKAAKRFYLEVVKRCRKTKLGREAVAVKWLPPMPRDAQ